jgi:predicted Zn-dependent protease with MMP-like domain
MRSRQERLADYRAAQRRYRPDREQLAQLAARLLDELPAEFRERLENVAIVVEEWPPAGREGTDTGEPDLLLGLYQGTPYTRRDSGYHLAAPDRITLYRGPILQLCNTPAEVQREVRDTLLHEIGHFFGLEEHELS